MSGISHIGMHVTYASRVPVPRSYENVAEYELSGDPRHVHVHNASDRHHDPSVDGLRKRRKIAVGRDNEDPIAVENDLKKALKEQQAKSLRSTGCAASIKQLRTKSSEASMPRRT